MKPKFKNCDNCGVRNFKDDEICGICQAPLTNLIVKPESPQTLKSYNGMILPAAVLFVVASLFMWVRFRTNEGIGAMDITSTINEVSGSVDPPREIKNLPGLSNIPPDYYKDISPIEYHLDKVDVNTKVKFVLTVRIDKKATTSQLLAIAESVKANQGLFADRGGVFFLLPEMINGDGAWACVEYKQFPSVRIIGQSLGDEQVIFQSAENISDYVGLWVDNSISGPIIMRMRLGDSGQPVYELIDARNPKPSELASYFKTQDTKNGKLFFDPEDPSDKFLF